MRDLVFPLAALAVLLTPIAGSAADRFFTRQERQQEATDA